MLTLYSLLILILVFALGLLATPFIVNKATNYRGFFIISLLASVFVFTLYYFSGNKQELDQWLSEGGKHYKLQEEFLRLGGVEGAIARINETLKSHPSDAQGWFILGKLYLARQKDEEALNAFTKAHQLQPENQQITQYYESLKK